MQAAQLIHQVPKGFGSDPGLLAFDRDWHKSHFGSNRASLSLVRKSKINHEPALL